MVTRVGKWDRIPVTPGNGLSRSRSIISLGRKDEKTAFDQIQRGILNLANRVVSFTISDPLRDYEILKVICQVSGQFVYKVTIWHSEILWLWVPTNV